MEQIFALLLAEMRTNQSREEEIAAWLETKMGPTLREMKAERNHSRKHG
jgi:hypothetical protein